MTPAEKILIEAIEGVSQSDITGIENTLALMAEGEGDNVDTYRIMALASLTKLRQALDAYRAEKEREEKPREWTIKVHRTPQGLAFEWDVKEISQFYKDGYVIEEAIKVREVK